MTTEERFLSKFRMPMFEDGCWLWEGTIGAGGYGQFWRGTRLGAAHRWSYEFYIGPIAAGMEIDHLCRNRACVNPAHLEPVTKVENMRRGLLPGNKWNVGRRGPHPPKERAPTPIKVIDEWLNLLLKVHK